MPNVTPGEGATGSWYKRAWALARLFPAPQPKGDPPATCFFYPALSPVMCDLLGRGEREEGPCAHIWPPPAAAPRTQSSGVGRAALLPSAIQGWHQLHPARASSMAQARGPGRGSLAASDSCLVGGRLSAQLPLGLADGTGGLVGSSWGAGEYDGSKGLDHPQGIPGTFTSSALGSEAGTAALHASSTMHTICKVPGRSWCRCPTRWARRRSAVSHTRSPVSPHLYPVGQLGWHCPHSPTPAPWVLPREGSAHHAASPRRLTPQQEPELSSVHCRFCSPSTQFLQITNRWQNHGKADAGGNLWRPPAPAPAQSRGV